MTERDDGGPAFPGFGQVFTTDASGRTGPQSMWGLQGAPGMSLRDWLAGQALAGMMSGWEVWPDETRQREIAEHAYALSDAMLEARKK